MRHPHPIPPSRTAADRGPSHAPRTTGAFAIDPAAAPAHHPPDSRPAPTPMFLSIRAIRDAMGGRPLKKRLKRTTAGNPGVDDRARPRADASRPPGARALPDDRRRRRLGPEAVLVVEGRTPSVSLYPGAAALDQRRTGVPRYLGGGTTECPSNSCHFARPLLLSNR